MTDRCEAEARHAMHLRLAAWGVWAGGGVPRGYQAADQDRAALLPDVVSVIDDQDAQRVEQLLLQLQERSEIVFEGVRHYYLTRLFDQVTGVRSLAYWLDRKYRADWRLADGLTSEQRADRLLDRALAALVQLETRP